MRWHVLVLPAAGLLAGGLALPHPSRDIPATAHESPARRLEVARLRAHFDSVDAELRAAPVLQSTAGRRASRATLIGWLREYREAGQFPRNDRFPQVAMPFFRDSHGTLCAMAYLIARSGRGDIVDRVALTRNNAFIAELADDAELRAWLDSVGLSVAEAARIQPEYGYEPPSVAPEDAVSDDYALTSILASGTSLATLGLNLIAPNKATGWAGIIAGSVGVIAGGANLDGNGGTQTVAAANMVIGGGAIAAGLYRLLAPGPARRFEPQVVATAGETGFGLAMHASF